MPSRYAFLALAVILAVSAILMSPFWPHAILPAVIFSGLSLIGLVDLGQSEHAIRRNYPGMTREDLSDMIDVKNYREVMGAVLNVSGFKEREAGASGEALASTGTVSTLP